MFGQGMLIKHGVKAALEECGCDSSDARAVGRVLAWGVSLLTFDVGSMAADVAEEAVSSAGEGVVRAGASAASEGATAPSGGGEVSFTGDSDKVAEYKAKAEAYNKEAKDNLWWAERYEDSNPDRAESYARLAQEKAEKARQYADLARFEKEH